MEVAEISARTQYIVYSAIFLATTVISIVLVIRYWNEIARLQSYGYLGAFIIAFIAGSSVPTPVSYIGLTFLFGGLLNPAIVGFVSGTGAAIGGTLVFLLGRSGHRLFPGLNYYSIDEQVSNKVASRFVRWAHRKGSIVVFLMSAMVNPAFAPMAIAMGAMRFRLIKFFIMCLAGNLVKAMVISYVGYIGIGTLLHLLHWLGRT
jgi:membrane protein DedA with SNARE-associated domain